MAVIIEIDKKCGYAGQILTNMSENDDLRDLKLVAGLDNEKISVHRLVMMSASKYFQALLGPHFKESQEEEVYIADIDGTTLKLIIDFCYTGQLQITDDNIAQIISAATAMELVVIEEKCQQFWTKILAASNCVGIFSVADRYSFLELRQRSRDMICEYFEEVSTSEVQTLTFSCFSELLKCDHLHAMWQEEFIFQRMTQWIDYDEINRSDFAPELFQLIRLEILAKPFLLDVVESFATKFNCLPRLMEDYHRRIENDGKPVEPYHLTTAVSKRIFVFSGKGGAFTIEKYNPISDKWELVHSFNDNSFKNRERFGQIFAENKIFLIGGKKGKTYMRTVDSIVLDSLEKQERKKIGSTRGSFSPILLNDHIYVFGGWNGSLLRTCDRLSLTTMQTKKLQPMQFGRLNYAAITMDGKIYVAGGQSSKTSYLCSVERYDPVANEWAKLSNMNHRRANFALVEYNRSFYAIGHHKSIERYDSVQDSWTVIGAVDKAETVRQAINMRNEIYVQMRNGKFGKFKIEPECSLQMLRRVKSVSSIKRTLFIN